MKLENKKNLAARTLGIGKARIIFNTSRLSDIKEAITKQDIRDLLNDNAIFIKEAKGRKVKEKRKNRRRSGSVKKKVKKGKREYVRITRQLRTYLRQARKKELPEKDYILLRKEIRASMFKDLGHFKERIRELAK